MLIQIFILAIFVLVHLGAGRLRFLNVIPRSSWLSLARGISVAYVFMHVLPELQTAQRSIVERQTFVSFVEHHAYLIALFGLAFSYGLERMAKSARSRPNGNEALQPREEVMERHVFWLHIGAFALYNALIGYLLLHREEQDVRGLLFFAGAMALHFLVNDYGLRQDHGESYQTAGRWILSAAILVGWAMGWMIQVSDIAVNVLFAFLAGGVILNVLKEELPEERQSRYSPFVAGTALYAELLALT